MITSISLSNWRSHADTTLQFSKGTNLLLGSMGSGKSSVLSAISFAFFGTFPELEHRKLALENVLRLNENNASVALEFLWNGARYKVERKVSRDKRGISTDACVYKDGMLLDKGTKAVTSYVENCLDIDYDLFTRSAYSEQNNLDYFLTVDPRKRKEELDILLGLDKFENARANAVSVINRVRSNRKTLEGSFSAAALKQSLEKRDGAKKSIEENRGNADLLGEKLAEQKHATAGMEKAFTELKKTRDLYESLSKDEIRYLSTVENLKKEIKEGVDEGAVAALKHAREALEKKYASIFSESRAMEGEFLRLSRQLAELESRLKANERSKAECVQVEKQLAAALGGETTESLLQKLALLEKHVLDINSTLVSSRARTKELAEIGNKLSIGASACPLCASPLTKEGISHVLSERKNAMEENRVKISRLEVDLPKTKAAQEKASGALYSAKLLLARIKAVRESIIDELPLRQEAEKFTVEAKACAAKKEELAKLTVGLSKEGENLAVKISETEANLKKKAMLKLADEKLTETKGKLAKISYDTKLYEEAQGKLQTAKISYEKLLALYNEAKSRLKGAEEIISIMEKEVLRLQSLQAEIAYLAKLEEELAIYKGALLETQFSLRANLVEAINLAMNEIWGIFYPHRNYRGIRLNVSEKDYSIEVHENAWKALESVASGGERACAALTLRVALATVLTPKLSLLILDEPTHNLDKDAIGLLSSTLQFKVPSIIDQVFIISHEEGLTGSDFATSYRLYRDKGNFGPTNIERV